MSIVLAATGCIKLRWSESSKAVWAVVACLTLKSFNDLSAAGLLCYHLQRSKTGLRQTDNLIRKMMEYGLRAGLLNCTGSVALVATLIFIPTKWIYLGVYVAFSRLYANSLLTMLNWRRSQKGLELSDSTASDPEDIELSSGHWGLSISSQIMRLTIPELEAM